MLTIIRNRNAIGHSTQYDAHAWCPLVLTLVLHLWVPVWPRPMAETGVDYVSRLLTPEQRPSQFSAVCASLQCILLTTRTSNLNSSSTSSICLLRTYRCPVPRRHLPKGPILSGRHLCIIRPMEIKSVLPPRTVLMEVTVGRKRARTSTTIRRVPPVKKMRSKRNLREVLGMW
jgi:hypothetical protein